MDEIGLARLCSRRDEAAWETFLAEYSNSIYTSIRRTLERHGQRPEQDTLEDIFGDVVVSLLADEGKKLLAFEGRNGSSMVTYLWVIASRVAIDHLRKSSRLPRIADTGDETVEYAPDHRELPDIRLEKRELACALEEVLAGLSAKDRLFVMLHYEKGLPTEEVAGILKISPSAVYSRKNRVREKMRNIFGKKSRGRASKYMKADFAGPLAD
jgi:RNA polymerase sigma factor (sigma-70 family)